MRKLGPREVKTFLQGHTALNLKVISRLDLNPGQHDSTSSEFPTHQWEEESLPAGFFTRVTPIWMHLF